jgi:hypothetical protein
MLSNFIQISLLIFVIYISYKSDFLIVLNYIIGFELVMFFTNLNFQGHTRYKEEIIVFLLNLFWYSVLFCSSIFIYFDEENDKKHYFFIPFLVYLVIMIFLGRQEFFMVVLPISIAFFPLYIIKFYRKFYR